MAGKLVTDKPSNPPLGRGTRVTMRLVVVESPFAGRLEVNRSYLIACLRDCYARSESPFASHAIGPLALRDEDPHEREVGIQAGFAWRSRADATVVYEDFGLSRGMQAGIADAVAIGCPIERRRLGGEWAKMYERYQQEAARNPGGPVSGR
jgi:hypothetical protein